MEFISRESVSCGKRGMWFRRNCFVSVNAVMINLYPNDCAGQKHYIVFRSYLIISFFHVNCSVLHDFNSSIYLSFRNSMLEAVGANFSTVELVN